MRWTTDSENSNKRSFASTKRGRHFLRQSNKNTDCSWQDEPNYFKIVRKFPWSARKQGIIECELLESKFVAFSRNIKFQFSEVKKKNKKEKIFDQNKHCEIPGRSVWWCSIASDTISGRRKQRATMKLMSKSWSQMEYTSILNAAPVRHCSSWKR